MKCYKGAIVSVDAKDGVYDKDAELIELKDKSIIAFGASPHSVKEGRLINREEIDAVCLGKEVMVVKYDGHACIISTSLLKKLNKKLSRLRGYHPDTGEMNQEAFFACSERIYRMEAGA